MKKINVVTGASGHIGIGLLKELKKNKEYVRVLILDENELKYIKDDIDEYFIGDVCNVESLKKCFENADTVYHLAGVITIGKENAGLLKSVNVEGTANVVKACQEMNVNNLIYTSSVHVLNFKSKTELLKEKDKYDSKLVVGNYAKSKADATNIVVEANSNKLRTVICLPSGVTGPYAYKRSNIGQLIIEFYNKKLSAAFKGKYNYVDVRDVAKGLYMASKYGKAGESYILSGEVVTIEQMFQIFTEITGVRPPRIILPIWFIKFFASLAELYYRIKKVKPLFTPYSIYTLTSNCNFDNSKAKKELKFSPRSIKKSLKDEYLFLKKSFPELFKEKNQKNLGGNAI